MRERVATALRRGGILLLTTAAGLAAAPGVVTTVADLGRRSYGRYVVIDHGGGDTTLYAHLDKLWAVPGQRVDQGHVIGLVGTSGGSSGPHLHFEERLNGKVQRPFFHGVEFKMPRTQASQNCSDVPVAGDWNGDGVDELAVFRRKAASKFRFAQTGAPAVVVSYGLPTDQPVIGDWDGNGTADLGVRRQRGNRFWLRNADGTEQVVKFGANPDLPVAGDWNGDRITDVGVFDSATATFVLRTVGPDGVPVLSAVPFGVPGDLPVAGDWNGDGISDIGVWRPSEGVFYQRVTPPAGRGTATVTTRKVGRAR